MNAPKVEPPSTASQPIRGAISPRLWAAAGAILLGRSFPPHGGGLISVLAYACLMKAALTGRNDAQAFAATWAGFTLGYALAFPWPWLHPYPGPAVAGTGALVLAAALPAVALRMAMFVRHRLGPGCAFVAAVAGMLTSESLLTHTAVGIPMSMAGLTMADSPSLWGVSAFAGVEGLSAMILSMSALTLHGLRVPREPGWSALLAVFVLGVVLRSVSVPGVERHGADDAGPTEARGDAWGELKVGVVQPGLSARDWAGDDSLRMRTLMRLSEDLVRREAPDVVLWPESALREPRSLAGTELISGLANPAPSLNDRRRAAPDAERYAGNSANAIAINTHVVYEKRRLVPFVERVPGEGWLPALGALRLDQAGLKPGERSPEVSLSDLPLGLAICFETLFAPHFQGMSGRRLLIGLTQDGWWDSPVAASQHLLFSRFRAIETGVPLVMASVNGYSALVAPDGLMIWVSGWRTAEATLVMPPSARPSRYPGNRIALPAFVVLFVLLALSRSRSTW